MEKKKKKLIQVESKNKHVYIYKNMDFYTSMFLILSGG